jgi:hypothetical protein
MSGTVDLEVAQSKQRDIGDSLEKPETPRKPKLSSLKRPAS